MIITNLAGSLQIEGSKATTLFKHASFQQSMQESSAHNITSLQCWQLEHTRTCSQLIAVATGDKYSSK